MCAVFFTSGAAAARALWGEKEEEGEGRGERAGLRAAYSISEGGGGRIPHERELFRQSPPGKEEERGWLCMMWLAQPARMCLRIVNGSGWGVSAEERYEMHNAEKREGEEGGRNCR